MKTLAAIIVGTFLLLFARPAVADLITLDDCRILEGETRDLGETVEISGPFGKLKIAHKYILKIDKRETPWAKFDRCFKAISANNATAFCELGRWAAEIGLKEQAHKALEAAIKADPENAEARARLGYEKVGAKWFRGDELYLAKGWVKVGESWYTPEEYSTMKKTSQAEADKFIAEVVALMNSTDPAKVAEGISKVKQLGPNRGRVFFANRLFDKANKGVRLASAKSLADYGKRSEIISDLVACTLADNEKLVRTAALDSLETLNDPRIVNAYNRALYSQSDEIRDRSMDAIGRFRWQESVPHLVNVIELHWHYGGGGSSYIDVTTIRSYIADYEGLIATQAAILDPVIRQVKTGTVLWINLKAVEIIKTITGVDMGEDPEAWREWLKGHMPTPYGPEK
ncbi:MAG: hypothetical protein WC712_13125 [Candidatus Brocadiia bacterium]